MTKSELIREIIRWAKEIGRMEACLDEYSGTSREQVFKARMERAQKDLDSCVNILNAQTKEK